MKRLFMPLLCVLAVLIAPPCFANDVQILKSSKGITAWLIEDHSLPIVSLSFAWNGGIETDDDAKQGLSHVAATMLTKGAAADDENAFLKKLQDNVISLSFQAQRDTIYGQLRTLKETLPVAQEALRASIMQPRFDDQSLMQVKAQNISLIKNYLSDPDWLMSRLMMREVYAGHPYSKRTLGTQATINSITKDDLKNWHKRLNRSELIVSATGDITKEELNKLLDETFGGLPEKPAGAELAEADLKGKTETFVLKYKGPQSSITVVWPGIRRNDKDWYAMEVMNYILGGGSFSSRLMSEVREKRGLTYGISSGMSLFDHGSSYSIQASFKNENAGHVLDLIKKEIAHMRDTKVSAEELKAAKDYLIGSYALSLTSTARVAGHYLEIQRQKLGVDIQQKREAALNAVTAEDVQRVAKRILQDASQITFFVGEPQGITATKTFDSVE
ncbi:MAG: pitrilysin family protein [Alphaproteobacteria bacterium]|nr:pitrilysin family protein [Alphaproteobacteria bacterium]